MFFFRIYLFLSLLTFIHCHPNSYCKGYCSTNYYCSPNSCRRRGGFYCSCAKCPSGKTSNSGSWDISQCTGCAAGKYFSNNNCVSCPAGKYQPYSSKTSCSNCPCGKYSIAGSVSCSTCPSGKISSANSATCLNCPSGKYNSIKGSIK